MRNSLRYLLVGFAFVAGSLFALAGVASAQDDSSDAYVLSNTESRTAELPAAASASTGSSGSAEANSLAFTGSDVVLLSAVGGVAVVAGGAILAARRRVAQA
ncbi:hypothetical protein [Dermatobacter hominis]|uniref:hypothetical protein n=1 Tax=Dermatobacter hominis TaxID=2884263 RepID=UPI001D0F751C|nr:hypothetical protein [Dermatobacter hominis]UDY37120.1 hypothetical protein LH044_06175 [Dermatobacter hominis]